MKLKFVLKVIMSCKTVDQLETSILWAALILSRDETARLMFLAQHVPNWDFAMRQAKETYLKYRRGIRLGI
jgi:hypothetical protein